MLKGLLKGALAKKALELAMRKYQENQRKKRGGY